MNRKLLILSTACFLFTIAQLLPWLVLAEEPKAVTPDKALCARMLRLGKDSYQRGKYLDAKEYFKKAVQANPTCIEAWAHYDRAVIFALAEKVEKDVNLILPGTSTRKELPTGVSPSPNPPPPKPVPGKKEAPRFEIVDDEGC